MGAVGAYPVQVASSLPRPKLFMRIGFDCAPLVIPHSPGIRRVVESTLRALEARGNVQVVRLAPAANENLRTWRRKGLAIMVREQHLLGLHAFQSAFCAGARVPSVQTVHELSWLHSVSEKRAWKQKLWIAIGRRKAAAVVCATQFSASDYTGDSKKGPRPTVIPWGVDDVFTAEECAEDRNRLQAWSLNDTPFVLSPGGLRSKKRPADLLRALAQTAPSNPAHAVFTGPPCESWPRLKKLAQDLGLERRVHYMIDLPDPELATLYRHAHATAVISHSEGFALPVLESLACGTVPLVTTHSAQSEVAACHGHGVAGRSQSALREALSSVLEAPQSPNPAGVQHARAFTWDKTAAGIEKLWETLI
ncbi:MAG: glycosyltransferase involved in cell wall biosynthesis [Planctomycetota bacterium]|jgi:glycosyltransferase involved in cell wall biosynthesis